MSTFLSVYLSVIVLGWQNVELAIQSACQLKIIIIILLFFCWLLLFPDRLKVNVDNVFSVLVFGVYFNLFVFVLCKCCNACTCFSLSDKERRAIRSTETKPKQTKNR